jgi:hypothetical protein
LAVIGVAADAGAGAGAATFGRGAGAGKGVFACCWEYPAVTTTPIAARAIVPIKARVVLMGMRLDGPAILAPADHVVD